MNNKYQGDTLRILSLNSNRSLAEKIARVFGTELGKSVVKQSSDGETSINIEESIRGDHVYIAQSTNAPVNDYYMELLIMIDAVKRASAGAISIALPYYGYVRQDRTAKSHGPTTAKLIANLIEEAGTTRILTLDLHTVQVQGFLGIPVDSLFTMLLFTHYYRQLGLTGDDIVVASPKNSDVQRACSLSKYLNSTLAVVDHADDASTEGGYVIGDVQGKICIMVDDILNTGATFARAANVLKENGAEEVYACASYGLLSDHVKSILNNVPIKDIRIIDSVFIEENRHPENLTIVTCLELMGEAAERIHENTPISPLFRLGEKEFE